MSEQFGRWNFDGQSVDPRYVAKARTLFAPYAVDAEALCVKGPFFLLHAALHSTLESRNERQPLASPTGTFLTWTGRLDNRSELDSNKERITEDKKTDLSIVASLYDREGTQCLGRLIGDWSLSALHYYERTLVLACDFLASRPLYFLLGERYVAWSTVLDVLVQLTDRSLTLNEDYVAGWLYAFPSAGLTPYREIQAVPPASFVKIKNRMVSTGKHWEFGPPINLRGLPDPEYEQRFRYFFGQAVRRRLRSSNPIVAELSGGMDSSSIVCVADSILAETPIAPRLDTLSYLDDAEPNWNERPFVLAVETKRHRSGLHVSVSSQHAFLRERDSSRFGSTPDGGLVPPPAQLEVAAYMKKNNVRIVLSGLGGDECAGGVPDSSPELADLLSEGCLIEFFRRGLAWSLSVRRPVISLYAAAIAGFFPQTLYRPSLLLRTVPWIHPDFERRQRDNEACRPLRLRLRGPLPSFQENLYALDWLRRQIFSAPLPATHDRRYPFLDRDLLEFLYAVPREQMVQPGRRRHLLRRALRGIVPEPVLERKRKAYVARAPMRALQEESAKLRDWTKQMRCAELGFIDLKQFHGVLEAARQGDDSHLWRISRTLTLESWLRDPSIQSVLFPVPGNLYRRSGSTTSQLGISTKKGGEEYEIREAGNSLRQ